MKLPKKQINLPGKAKKPTSPNYGQTKAPKKGDTKTKGKSSSIC